MCHPVVVKWSAVVVLVAQNVSVVTMMRYTRAHASQGSAAYLTSTAVVFAEVVKLACSLVLIWLESDSPAAVLDVLKENVFGQPREMMKVSVPSLLYAAQNNLLFISVSNLSGGMHSVLSQMKILSTAVFSVLLLGTSLSYSRWFSLFLLTVAVVVLQYPRAGDDSEAITPSKGATIGVLAALSACLTSGLAGVYLEKTLKDSGTSIWVRNFQLALVGSITALLLAYAQDAKAIQEAGFLQGYTPYVVAVVLLQSLGGISTAVVLKYADNILKCFAMGFSVVMTCWISAYWFHELVVDTIFLAGTMLVLCANALYILGLPDEFIPALFRHQIEGPTMHLDSEDSMATKVGIDDAVQRI